MTNDKLSLLSPFSFLNDIISIVVCVTWNTTMPERNRKENFSLGLFRLLTILIKLNHLSSVHFSIPVNPTSWVIKAKVFYQQSPSLQTINLLLLFLGGSLFIMSHWVDEWYNRKTLIGTIPDSFFFILFFSALECNSFFFWVW